MPNTPMGTQSPQDRRQLVRAVIASTIGTTIEWYDFFLYSAVTGLVFARLYFPNSEPLVGTLQAFGIFAVGFLARPIGAFIFGHYGDRVGRKSTLITTLLLMGLSTFAVALVPTYDSIGIWVAVLLTALRFIQGVGVGGEWGGSVLLAMEWAKTSAHRGFIASWPQFGVPTGLFLANLAVLGFSALSGDAFLEWGWRSTAPAMRSQAIFLYPPSRAWPRRCSCPITQTRIFRHAENRSKRLRLSSCVGEFPDDKAAASAILAAAAGGSVSDIETTVAHDSRGRQSDLRSCRKGGEEWPDST